MKDKIMSLTEGRKAPPEWWPHQAAGVGFVASKRAAMLACDMGTGKSAVAIGAVEGRGAALVLVVCPKSVLTVWPHELNRHARADWKILLLDKGSGKDKAALLTETVATNGARPLWVVVNYESLWRQPLADAVVRVRWDAVVFDESQRLKSPGGKASRFAWKLTHGSARSFPVPFRLGLSGTVVHDTPLDLYAQFRALDSDVLGRSYTEFKARYCVMNPYIPGKVERFVNTEELAQRIRPMTYQVSADVLRLEEPVHVERFCVLGPQGRRVYRELQEELCSELDGGTVSAANAMVKALKLQEVTSGFVRDEDGRDIEVDTGKREALAEVFEDLAAQEPVVVFCRFRHDLLTIMATAARMGRAAGQLSGERNDLAAWQRGDFPVLAVQIQAGGVGVDLTRARCCVYFSVGYSLGDFRQSLARVQRPGQTRQVLYVHLICERTVDAAVYRALREKREVADVVLEEVRRARTGVAA